MDNYTCCLCGEAIESAKESVTSLLVTINWQKSEDEQESQQLFCHIECLKKAMKNSDYLYIGD